MIINFLQVSETHEKYIYTWKLFEWVDKKKFYNIFK